MFLQEDYKFIQENKKRIQDFNNSLNINPIPKYLNKTWNILVENFFRYLQSKDFSGLQENLLNISKNCITSEEVNLLKIYSNSSIKTLRKLNEEGSYQIHIDWLISEFDRTLNKQISNIKNHIISEDAINSINNNDILDIKMGVNSNQKYLLPEDEVIERFFKDTDKDFIFDNIANDEVNMDNTPWDAKNTLDLDQKYFIEIQKFIDDNPIIPNHLWKSYKSIETTEFYVEKIYNIKESTEIHDESFWSYIPLKKSMATVHAILPFNGKNTFIIIKRQATTHNYANHNRKFIIEFRAGNEVVTPTISLLDVDLIKLKQYFNWPDIDFDKITM